MVKNWLDNELSPASRQARRQDITAFIDHAGIKSIEDFKGIDLADIIRCRESVERASRPRRYLLFLR
ncbi:MAG: hypothetical protein KGJ95_09400 [Candidatus Omnitrophica bacterium]|nr:hypothetical protein [Candidatus Omnitrophota bacterium]MDE2232257.1 hypothetical protein [Candidatus Omnitrophota bacterium]